MRLSFTKGETYKGLPTVSKGIYPLVVQVLDRIHGQLEAMQSYHQKVCFIRIDLGNIGSNAHLTKILRSWTKWIKAKYSLARVGYVWARESSSRKGRHYHLILLVDGNKVKSAHHIRGYFNGKAETAFVPKDGVKLLCRGDRGALADAFKAASYLAVWSRMNGLVAPHRDFCTLETG